MQFPEQHRAPASSYWEREIFFLLSESGKLLGPLGGELQEFMLLKAQKYLWPEVAFVTSSLNVSLPLSFPEFRGLGVGCRKARLASPNIRSKTRERENSHSQPLDSHECAKITVTSAVENRNHTAM